MRDSLPIEKFKDAAALVTDVLAAPFESSLEIYRSFRKDGIVSNSGNGVNPIQAAGWVIGAKVIENISSLPLFITMPNHPILNITAAAVNQIAMGNITAEIIRNSYDSPRYPRTTARRNTLATQTILGTK
jgi:hypothetical protein